MERAEGRAVVRPRAWADPEGCSSTIVLLDEGSIFLHTNMGWVPVGLQTYDPRGEEVVAEEMAKGYELEEVSEERAWWLSGKEKPEHCACEAVATHVHDLGGGEVHMCCGGSMCCAEANE